MADFEQKPWAIAHGFEHGRFWQVLEVSPNSLKRLQTFLKRFLTEVFARRDDCAISIGGTVARLFM